MDNHENERPYKVGYCKPSKDAQWKKGQSGNPGGRPKGSKSYKTLLAEEGRERITIVKGGKPKRITIKRAIVKRAYHKALVDDDFSYLKALGAFDEVEEAPEQRLTFTLDLDGPPPANDWQDDDFDYSQPQLKQGGSTAPE